MAPTQAALLRIVPPVDDTDRAWLADLWRTAWGGEIMVTRGRVYHLAEQAALLAWRGDQRVGAATYRLDGDAAELMSINALLAGQGIGTALLAAVETAVRAAGCHRLWLITTNDNLDSLRFYQRRGYRLVALHPGAVDQARLLKPTIPLVGNHGIPLRDELELERRW